LFKSTLIAAALIATSATTFAQTAATPAPAKPATTAASAPAATAPAKPAAAPAAATSAAPAAKTANAESAVKKSKNDICHDQSSSGYKATTNFKPFATMDECIKSGGRAPKGSEPKAAK